MTADLAGEFQSVDAASNFEAFSSCLTLIDSLPFFAECKRQSYDLLGATPGRRILEVGCGLGDDAASLARLVAPGGSVVAIDGSQTMITAARERHCDLVGLSFDVADAAQLPFDNASFDACRIDRVLQHIADPVPAVREMVRVLRPGGVLVAYDNDWETLTVDGVDRELTRAVLNAWCDRFPSGWIGRRLVPLFLQAGLRDVVTYPKTLVLRELGVADQIFSLLSTAERLAKTGVISRSDADHWSDALRTADAEQRFFTSYTGFLVSGTRRGGAGPPSSHFRNRPTGRDAQVAARSSCILQTPRGRASSGSSMKRDVMYGHRHLCDFTCASHAAHRPDERASAKSERRAEFAQSQTTSMVRPAGKKDRPSTTCS
jgi:ubiquinone/menaquinone biosynthesis C-methylase UbiE